MVNIPFICNIVNFLFICSNIPATSAYNVYISESQLIRYSRACGSCQHFLDGRLGWSHHFESFTVAIMTWLTIKECLCHWYISFVVTLEQELYTLPEYLTEFNPDILIRFVLLNLEFSVWCSVDYWFVLLSFSFLPLHCLSYDLPLQFVPWYLQTLVSKSSIAIYIKILV